VAYDKEQSYAHLLCPPTAVSVSLVLCIRGLFVSVASALARLCTFVYLNKALTSVVLKLCIPNWTSIFQGYGLEAPRSC